MSGARERIRRVTGSLYWRQFMLTAGMVLLTLALLGVSFYALSYNYTLSEKRQEMRDRAVLVAQLSVDYFTAGEHVNQDVGFALQEAGFTRSRIHGRSCYRIVPRDPRRLDFIDEPAEEDKKESVADNPLARALLAGLGGLAPQKP